jgi:hypothetical protein
MEDDQINFTADSSGSKSGEDLKDESPSPASSDTKAPPKADHQSPEETSASDEPLCRAG